MRLIRILAWQLAAAAALFLAVELGARRSIARIPPAVIGSGLKNPPFYNNPGVTTSPRAFGYRLKYTINRAGLRGPETTVAKPPLTRRILLVGDSVVFGAMVREEETLSAQLQRELASVYPRTAYEVLNGGVGGYDLWDEEAWLRLKGLDFEPDIVVVGLYRNDHIGRDEYAATTARKSAPNRPLLAAVRDLLFRSEAVNAAVYWLQRHQPAKNPPLSVEKPLKAGDGAAIDGFFPGDAQSARAVKDYLRDYRYDPYLVKDALPWLLDGGKWSRVEAPLRGIKTLCAERGVKLIVLVFPVQFEAYPGYRWPEPDRALEPLFRKLGIPAVFLRPAFAGHGGDELYLTRYDYSHPGAEGYRVAREALLARLYSLRWLK